MSSLVMPTATDLKGFGVDTYNPYPEEPCDTKAVGFKLVVQVRKAREKSKGNVYIPESAQETAQYFTDVAKVIDIGPMAFRDRETGKAWEGGAWCKVGDFIRIRPVSSTLKFWQKGDAKFAVIYDEHVDGIVDPSAARDE